MLNLNKIIFLCIALILSCQNDKVVESEVNPKKVWDFSKSHNKAKTGLSFEQFSADANYAPGNLKIVFADNKMLAVEYVCYHVYIDKNIETDVSRVFIALPDMLFTDLDNTFKEYVKMLGLEEKHDFQIDDGVSQFYCYAFSNTKVWFGYVFKDDYKVKGLIEIQFK